LGQGERKRVRGPVQERFATASTVMRATESAFGHLKVWHRLHQLLERADLPLRTVELVYAAAGSGLLTGLFFVALGRGLLFTVVGMAIGAAIPIMVVSYKAKRRLTTLEDQLPDLLITLAASLKAGHSFRQGIQAVVDEGQPPASKEFKRVLTETQLGRPMDEALAEMAERNGSKNLSFVVTAVTIQRQVGGSLAGIFDMVAEAVRQRQQFARKIRSLTAMGRASAYVLVGIPFFMLGSISLVNPEYMDALFNTSIGHKLMILGAVMMAFGSVLLRKIVSFRG
jgi:tight adherence protein B